MQLNITFRQFGSSDALKEYAKEKVERVNKYLDRAGEAHVVLSLERHLHHAEITIHSGSWVLRGREKSEDMYASIDLAMDKIEAQLRKYKEKIKNHHGRERVGLLSGRLDRRIQQPVEGRARPGGQEDLIGEQPLRDADQHLIDPEALGIGFRQVASRRYVRVSIRARIRFRPPKAHGSRTSSLK